MHRLHHRVHFRPKSPDGTRCNGRPGEMDTKELATQVAQDCSRDPRWLRVSAIGCAVLFFGYILWTRLPAFTTPEFTDHLSFWAAGRLALQGDAASAYDLAAHAAVMQEVMPVSKVLAFPYPPPFLAIVMPFSVGGYFHSFAAWLFVTGTVYALVWRQIAPLPYGFSHPAAFVNGYFGQAGLLVQGIFLAGIRMLEETPLRGGAVLGLLIVKPHYGLLLPVVVIAARKWPAILGAALTTISLLLISLALFGTATFDAYFSISSKYLWMFAAGRWAWEILISPFALALYFGLSPTFAVFVHLFVAAFAVFVTWFAWSQDWQEKLPILASATLLISPYLLTYDSLLLAAPIGYWLTKQRRPFLALLVWFLCLFPALAVVEMYRGPNTVALASIISLAALTSERLPRGWLGRHARFIRPRRVDR